MSEQDEWATGWQPEPATAVGQSARPVVTGPSAPAVADPPAPATGPQPPTRPRPATGPLSAETLVRARRPRPRGGWRRLAHTATGGLLNPGPSTAERAQDALLDRVRAPLDSARRIAVISLKGGVGKTTTAAGLGATLADAREDQVVALDANPDLGTLAARLAPRSAFTLRDMLDRLDTLHSYGDVRRFTVQGRSRLEVVASDQDPAISRALTEQEYRAAVAVLARYYRMIVTDSGTGMLHDAMNGVLGLADEILLVTSPSVDGARSADATLDWLAAHGLAGPPGGVVTVLNRVPPRGGDVDVPALAAHFAARCRAVVRIPQDDHLDEGGVIDLDRLRPATRRAYLELAATVLDPLAG